MTEHLEAGSTRSGPLWQDDYLAPPAIPTGEKPSDVLNVIWRKNDVFLDIGEWALGSAVMVLHTGIFTAIAILLFTGGFGGVNLGLSIGYSIVLGIPILILLYGLTKPVPPPIRFNRQRREVCVPQKDGSHWFVSWESVKAVGTAVSSVGQHGRSTQGLLVIGFPNPQWDGKSEEGKEYSLALSCGGGTTAMAMWECIRSYMEVGPDAVPKCNFEGENQRRSLLGWYYLILSDAAKAFARGDIGAALKDVFFTICLGVPIGLYLQERKLVPPPDLIDPTVVEWSKSLPPEQWAKRSPELQRAILAREAELAEEADRAA